MNEDKYGYMCLIDWNWELGAALGGNTIYPNIEDLKSNHTMWKSCGIVKVKISFEEVIHESEGWGLDKET